MPRIFISYRRADSKPYTDQIYTYLERVFRRNTDAIFLDVEPGNILEGLDFRQVLQDAVARAEVMLVIIGPHWLDIREQDNPNQRRINNPDDFVRIEIESALNTGILVIPVLVGGASMPTEAALPDSLKSLAYRNARTIRGHPDFNRDMEQLVARIREGFPAPRRASPGVLVLGTVMALIVVVAAILSLVNLAGSGSRITETPNALDTQAAQVLTQLYESSQAALVTPSPTANLTETLQARVAELQATDNAIKTLTATAFTPTSSYTPTASLTPTFTLTASPTETPTETSTHTATVDLTETNAAIQAVQQLTAEALTQSAGNIATNTLQPTPTFTTTWTPTPTATDTFTPSPTPSDTATATPNLTATAQAVLQITATANAEQTRFFEIARATQDAQATQDAATLAANRSATSAAAETAAGQITVESPMILRARVLSNANNANVNIRSRASTTSDIVNSVQPGAELEIVGQNSDNSWYQVRLPNGQSGWIAAFLVETFTGPAFVGLPTAEPTVAEEPTEELATEPPAAEEPTAAPTEAVEEPTEAPTAEPTAAEEPTAAPTEAVEEPTEAPTEEPAATEEVAATVGRDVSGSITNVCLVTDVGRINDGTFNQFAYEGMLRAAEAFDIEYNYVETQNQADYAANIQVCINDGYQAIVTVGFLIADATYAAAEANPELYFIGVDQFVSDPLPNLVGIQYREDQAGYLAGVMAGLMTESNIIAGVYGIDIPPVVKYRNGYENGAKSVNPGITTLGIYIPNFLAPAEGAEAAEAFIADGADVIFGAGGPTGSGGITRAAEWGIKVIGVDQDEFFSTFGEGETPGAEMLITSAVKRVDLGVYNLLTALSAGGFEWPSGSIYILDATNGGISFAEAHLADVPAEVTAQVQDVLRKLASGEIMTGVNPVTGALLEG